MGGKQLAIYAGLFIVIVLAVVIGVKRTSGLPPPPDWLLDQQVQKIDCKTLDLFTEKNRDWFGKYAANPAGFYKNPKTGTHTMTDTMICSECGQLIPIPDCASSRVMKGDEAMAEIARIEKAYMCPRCRKHPRIGGGPPLP